MTSAIPAIIYSAQGKTIALPSAKQRARSVMGSFLQPYAVQPSGSPMSRSHSNGVRSRITPSCSAPSYQKANGWPILASKVGKGSPFLPKHARKSVWSPCFAIARIRRSWKGRTTGICRPASSAGIRFLPAADSPLSPQAAGYGNTPRGLNNTSAARLPVKSATMNTRRRRCESAGSPQYWASKSRQAVSARPPRTIPACAHSPLSGTETSIPVNAWSTAAKSSRSFEENAPATFSQTAKAGYRLFVAYLISSIIRMA